MEIGTESFDSFEAFADDGEASGFLSRLSAMPTSPAKRVEKWDTAVASTVVLPLEQRPGTGDLPRYTPLTDGTSATEPAGDTAAKESPPDLLAEYTAEREQMRREIAGVRLLIKQSEHELMKLNDRKAEAAADVASIEEKLQLHTREQIRETYLAAGEVEMRLVMIREELDKLRAKLKICERCEELLTRTIETLEALPDPDSMSDPGLQLITQMTSGTLPYLRGKPGTDGLPSLVPPAGGLPPGLGQAAATRAVQAQEEVRSRVAQQLHETVMQGLVNLALATEICEKLVASDPAASMEELKHLKEMIGATVQQASKAMLALRPLSLDGAGLITTIQRFATALAAEHGIQLGFSAPHSERKLAPDTAIAVFRVAQEAIQNAVQHSQASEINVTVSFEANGLSVAVEDDGIGVDVEQAMARAVQHDTAGILSMLERAEMLGGWLRMESKPGEGTAIELYAPV